MSSTDADAPLGTSIDAEYARERNQARNRLRRHLSRPTRLVCIGGGTGLPVVLRGLSRKVTPTRTNPGVELTAIVAMSDDGGSSGRLRRLRGLLPPGDVRNCLVAMSGEKAGLRKLFQHRFDGARGIGGHAVGNLVLAALTELKGDFLQAVEASSRLLETKGRVLPCTLEPTQLVAELDDSTQVFGERNIARARRPVRRVTLEPSLPRPAAGVIEAIREADLIAIGPGSLFSSVLPNLLVDGVAEALRETRALKVLVSNLMTEPGETDGMDCVDHTRAVISHVGPVVDVVLVNARRPEEALLGVYAKKHQHPVTVDRRSLIELGVIPVEADLLREGNRIRHDGRKVARCLLQLARNGL